MNSLPTRLIIITAAALLFILLILIIIFAVNTKSGPGPASPTPTTVNQQKIIPPVINKVPTIPLEKGGGIDENSQVIKNSINEIQKLYPNLPFKRDYVSSGGVDISIVIPGKDLQKNPWTLTAQIFGINYNTSPDQPDYETMKKSFREASQLVFSWIKTNGADPEKIIFVWGDRKYIQDQAEKWVQENN